MPKTVREVIYLLMKSPNGDGNDEEWYFKFYFHVLSFQTNSSTFRKDSLTIPAMSHQNQGLQCCSPQQEAFVRDYLADPVVLNTGRVTKDGVGFWKCQDNTTLFDLHQHLIQDHGAVLTSKELANQRLNPDGGHKSGFYGAKRSWTPS